MSLLVCENVAVGYGGAPVVEGLNFAVERGDYLYIVGENGSGKSTLMKTLLGLMDPLSGRIAAGDGLQRTEIGYLPQQNAVQKDFPASVREIVLSGCLNRMGFRPFYSRREKELAARNMARLGLADLADRCYRELSGGQQQRALLARALCAARSLIMLDEPVAGLDPKVAAEMYGLVAALNRDEGVTVVMISHDVAAAGRYATRVLCLGDGKYFFGSRAEYLSGAAGSFFAEPEGGKRQ